MDLRQYKVHRSKNFPLPAARTQPSSQRARHDPQTLAIISSRQSDDYHVHHDRQSGQVVLLGAHQYIRRSFDHIFQQGSDEGDRELVEKILPVFEQRLSSQSHNLFIAPVLDCQPMDSLIFPKTGYTLQEISPVPETPNSIIRTTILSMLKEKGENTVISLSVMGVQPNGSLIDELDYEWLQEAEDVQKARRQKHPMKVSKERGQVKIFELSRQQISTWQEAKEILFHYHQLSSYLEACQDCQSESGEGSLVGLLYEVSEVQIDPEFGTILATQKKCFILRINQYLQKSNLMMMRVTQCLHELVTGTKSKNMRDYPLIMLLSDCFVPKSGWQVTLLTQLKTNDTLKEEAVCLQMNLEIPGTHLYLKNYHDDKKVAREVEALGIEFSSTHPKERRSQVPKMNQEAIGLWRESQKVMVKSFIRDTKSSFSKKRGSQAPNQSGFNVPKQEKTAQGTTEDKQAVQEEDFFS